MSCWVVAELKCYENSSKPQKNALVYRNSEPILHLKETLKHLKIFSFFIKNINHQKNEPVYYTCYTLHPSQYNHSWNINKKYNGFI